MNVINVKCFQRYTQCYDYECEYMQLQEVFKTNQVYLYNCETHDALTLIVQLQTDFFCFLEGIQVFQNLFVKEKNRLEVMNLLIYYYFTKNIAALYLNSFYIHWIDLNIGILYSITSFNGKVSWKSYIFLFFVTSSLKRLKCKNVWYIWNLMFNAFVNKFWRVHLVIFILKR